MTTKRIGPNTETARYAIISDVHSNLHALKAVLTDLDDLEVKTILCAGDLVGYGAFPNEVVNLLKERSVICISGNHDRAVVNLDTSNMNDWAKKAIEWTIKIASEETREFLRKLNPRMDLTETGLFPDGSKVGLFHGSPFDDDEYIEDYAATDTMMIIAGTQVVITGHTHRPFINKLPHGVWINPGAVGQPRDRDWRASYAIYDETTKEYQIKRVEYPVEEAAQAIYDARLPRELGDRLKSGY